MKCSKCSREWTSERTNSQIINCPYCGAPLVSDLGKSDELTMQDVVSMIVECFGTGIIAQEKRFLAVFKDFAPKLQYEHKILKIAFEEDIAGFFLDCPVDSRAAHAEKATKALDAILSKEASKSVVQAFLKALGWTGKPQAATKAQAERKKLHEERLKETMKNIESSDSSVNVPKSSVQATVEDLDDDEGNYATQRISSAASMSRRADGDYLKKGTECQKNGRYDEAVQWFTKAADLGNAYAKRALMQIEKEQQDLINQGDNFRKQGNLKEAIQRYRSAVEKASSKAKVLLAQVLLEQGNAYRDKGNMQEAMKWYQLADENGNTQAKDTMSDALLMFANKCRDKGNMQEAMKWYQLADENGNTQAKDTMSDALLMFGNKCRDKGNMQEAMKWYQLADENGNTQAKDTMSDALLMFGNKCRDKGDMQEATKWYQLANNVGNIYAQEAMQNVLIEQGRNCRNEGEFQKAIEFYKKALQLGGMEAQDEILEVQEICTNLEQGGELRKQGNLDEAMDVYQKALNKGYAKVKDLISSIMLEKKGNAAYNSGDIEGAMKYYQMAIDSGDDAAREAIAEITYEEGRGCYECGFVEDSIKWLAMAAENGNDSIIMKIADMCKVILGSGDIQTIETWSKVILKNLTLTKMCLQLAEDCYKDGAEEAILSFYQLALDSGLKPTQGLNELAARMFEKGRACISEGDKFSAKQWYKRAADLGHKEAEEALFRLQRNRFC